MDQKPRNLFTKERFLEGNRQKWCILFLMAGGIILGMDAYQLLKDPAPYLTFLTFLAGAFILGYSGSETMKLFRAVSVTENQNIDQEVNETKHVKEEKDINLNEHILSNNAKEDDYNIREINI